MAVDQAASVLVEQQPAAGTRREAKRDVVLKAPPGEGVEGGSRGVERFSSTRDDRTASQKTHLHAVPKTWRKNGHVVFVERTASTRWDSVNEEVE